MSRRELMPDLFWGARWGGILGAVFMLFAAVVILLKGGQGISAPEEVNVGLLLLAYPASGVVAGSLVGLFRPFLRTRRGAIAVGMLAAIPVSIVFLRLVKGPFNAWGVLGWLAALLGAAWIGGMGGYIWWGQLAGLDPMLPIRTHDKQQRAKRERRRHRRTRQDRRRDESNPGSSDVRKREPR